MMTVVSIVLVIGALIFFHELGHLILAKRAGILCREFALGFGPKVFSFKMDETVYTLRLLPLGGFVRMAGEDPEVIEVKSGQDVGLIFNKEGHVVKLILNNKKDYPDAEVININKVDLEHDLYIKGYNIDEQPVHYAIHPQALMVRDHQDVQIAPHSRQFAGKTLGQRAATIFAGPVANFLLAFVILFIFAMMNGVPVTKAIVGDVLPDSAAEEAGLQEGDVVLSVDHTTIREWGDLKETISAHPNEELLMIIERNGAQRQIKITPAPRENQRVEGKTEGIIGVTQPTEKSFLGSVQYGFFRTIDFALLIFTSLGMLVSGDIPIDDLAGPVGIFDYTGQAAEAGLPILLQWTAILSVNLGIFNLLPIPALDGGRLLFLGIELIRGRPIDPHKEGLVHFIGFALLMLLVLVVTWNDIQRLFF